MATVGYNVNGGSQHAVSNTFMGKFRMPENGRLASVSIYYSIFNTTQCRLGLYANDGSSDITGATLIKDFGQTSASGNGVFTITGSNITDIVLAQGLDYWLVWTGNGTGQIGYDSGLKGNFISTLNGAGQDSTTPWSNPGPNLGAGAWGNSDTIYLTYTPLRVGHNSSGILALSGSSSMLKISSGDVFNTKSISLFVSGSGDASLRVTSSGVTYILPNQSTTFVGINLTQSLTNKSGSFIQIQIPSSGSAPVFTPTQASDRVTMFFNTGSNELCFYSNGVWKSGSFV